MLIALDRNNRQAWAVLRRLVDHGQVPTLPTVVIAQAWRDGLRQARLAQALGHCMPEQLTDPCARRVGELCRRSGTADIVGAVIVESASRHQNDICTSDPGDLEHLASYVARRVTVIPI